MITLLISDRVTPYIGGDSIRNQKVFKFFWGFLQHFYSSFLATFCNSSIQVISRGFCRTKIQKARRRSRCWRVFSRAGRGPRFNQRTRDRQPLSGSGTDGPASASRVGSVSRQGRKCNRCGLAASDRLAISSILAQFVTYVIR